MKAPTHDIKRGLSILRGLVEADIDVKRSEDREGSGEYTKEQWRQIDAALDYLTQLIII